MGLLTTAKPADLTIPKLQTGNYKVWRELIIEALEGRGVWDYVEGLISKPSSGDDLRVWRQNNAVATGIIKGALSESQLGHVMGMRDAQETWDTLQRIHQRDDSSRVQSLLAEFVKFRLDTTVDEGASYLTRLQSEISTLNYESRPSDTIKTETLLAGLGPEFEPTLVGLEASGTMAFEDTVSRLKKAEARIQVQGQESQTFARFTSSRQDRSSRSGVKGVCYHCGKSGHFKRSCKKLLAEQSKGKGKSHEARIHGTSQRKHRGGKLITGRNEEQLQEDAKAWLMRPTAAGTGQKDDLWYLEIVARSSDSKMVSSASTIK